jgi:hypothetical protein
VFSCDWRAVVLFRDRMRALLPWWRPEPLALRRLGLREAARLLGLGLARA